MDTFRGKLDEDLGGFFSRLGNLTLNKALRTVRNTKSLFWTALGDQVEAGKLDLNTCIDELNASFDRFIGQQQLGRTVVALVTFFRVIYGESVFDMNTILKMMIDQPNLTLPCPNQQEITALFKGIADGKVAGPALAAAAPEVKQWAVNDQNRALINEWMCQLLLTHERLLSDQYMRGFLPYMDRVVSNQEYRIVLTAMARDILRREASNDPVTKGGKGKGSKDSTDSDGDEEEAVAPKSPEEIKAYLENAPTGAPIHIEELENNLRALKFDNNDIKLYLQQPVSNWETAIQYFSSRFTLPALVSISAVMLAIICKREGGSISASDVETILRPKLVSQGISVNLPTDVLETIVDAIKDGTWMKPIGLALAASFRDAKSAARFMAVLAQNINEHNAQQNKSETPDETNQ